MTDEFALSIPEIVGIPLAAKRSAQPLMKPWPAGTLIVSPDSHMIERDCWYDKFPEALKAKAPRMQFKDGGFHFTIEGKSMLPEGVLPNLCEAMECNPGLSDVKARLHDLDVEGVDKELIFPQRLFGLYVMGMDHGEMREEIFSIYNEDIAERCAEADGRLYPVMIPNFWDLSKTRQSLVRIKELGGRAAMLPNKPGKDINGEQIHYNDPRQDPLWAAIEESRLPICFHIGEKVTQDQHGAFGTEMLVQLDGFRLQWGMLTFGGVFDRFPSLKVAFIEAGIHWVASMLYDADLAYNSFPNFISPILKHPPSWYWRNHCYASFMTDPVGLQTIDRIGVDTAMWSSDYPHQESTFGYTSSAIQAVFDAVPNVEDAQKILGKTAIELFDMHEPYTIPIRHKVAEPA